MIAGLAGDTRRRGRLREEAAAIGRTAGDDNAELLSRSSGGAGASFTGP